ncbi:MAG: DUF1491 family protein [Sphingopyxis sp.]|nr:DUF1491 family protein [Sphingopyxis sp.]
MSVPPARLTSAMLVAALMRRVFQAGGSAAVLRRGDDQAGAVWIECNHRGETEVMLERATDFDGREQWRIIPMKPAQVIDADGPALAAPYWHKRAQSDPDLWVIELDIANAERFAAETIASA